MLLGVGVWVIVVEGVTVPVDVVETVRLLVAVGEHVAVLLVVDEDVAVLLTVDENVAALEDEVVAVPVTLDVPAGVASAWKNRRTNEASPLRFRLWPQLQPVYM